MLCPRLADLRDPHLLVQGDLQRSTVGNGQSNGAGFGRKIWRGGLSLGSSNLCWNLTDKGLGKQKHQENSEGHHCKTGPRRVEHTYLLQIRRPRPEGSCPGTRAGTVEGRQDGLHLLVYRSTAPR